LWFPLKDQDEVGVDGGDAVDVERDMCLCVYDGAQRRAAVAEL
jgi:hypothetical protein